MMYHFLSLLLLVYLVWRRPVAGMVVGLLEGMWLLWPIYGLPELVSFNVHLTLALTCLFAWRKDDIRHSMGLALAGSLGLGVLYYAPLASPGRPTAVLGGILCGELVAAGWMAGRLICRNHSEDRENRAFLSIRRAVWTLASLNAPLGIEGKTAASDVNASGAGQPPTPT